MIANRSLLLWVLLLFVPIQIQSILVGEFPGSSEFKLDFQKLGLYGVASCGIVLLNLLVNYSCSTKTN